MGIKGGGAEGVRMPYQAWGEHVTGGKILAVSGVNAILQTLEWRQRSDKVWYDFYGPANFDLEAGQAEQIRIVNKRLSCPLKIIVTENILKTNFTGDWQAHKSMLDRTAELAEAGKLRVARAAVNMAIAGPYPFSIYDFDNEFSNRIGARRGLFLEGADGPAIYPANTNPKNINIIQKCEAGFDNAWLLSGVDIVNGPAAHVGQEVEALERPDESLVAEKTSRYIGELAAAGGWH